MDDAPGSDAPEPPAGPPTPNRPDPDIAGRLSIEAAQEMLRAADASLAEGDFRDAAVRYGRVVGVDDASVSAAALLGLGEARYRLDDDEAALRTWEMATQVGETPSTYVAWRNVAAARVRRSDLHGAIDAYRQAERRAPAEDRAEIATRLGWLTKEVGDTKASRKYFARGRGDGPLIPVHMVILAATVIVSLTAMFSNEGQALYDLLQLDKQAVADGEYWRLWTVTLLHGSPLHLAFNMYALYLAGPIVERWYGSVRFLGIYLACAAGGSVASFAFGGDVPSVGASGAIFGLFGMLLAANRLHHPVDRQSRMIVGQLGMLILINIAFGFAVRGIDNAAHIGGLLTGLWLGAIMPPTNVQTLSSLWQRPAAAVGAHRASLPLFVPVLAFGVVALAVVVLLIYGTAVRTG